MRILQSYWPVFVAAVILLAITLLNVRPYGGNITSVFHMDEKLAGEHTMPKNFVVLKVPSYDGAQYYQIARIIPKTMDPSQWAELRSKPPGSYAYQRFLLPFSAYVVSFGRDALLPWAFLLINIASLLGASVLLLRMRPEAKLTSFALALSPAAMVAMHFALAEPLTILLVTAVLLRLKDNAVLQPLDILLLSLAVVTREVNILFIGFLGAWFLWNKQWADAAKLAMPAAVFVALHTLIFVIFGNVPFLISAGARELPGQAALTLLFGGRGYNRYTLSAIAILLGFVLPTLIWSADQVRKNRGRDLLTLGSLVFLCVMLVMPGYIWGSITSIGRVITPVYPLTLLALSEKNTRTAKILTTLVLLLGLGTGIGLALQIHPFMLTA